MVAPPTPNGQRFAQEASVFHLDADDHHHRKGFEGGGGGVRTLFLMTMRIAQPSGGGGIAKKSPHRREQTAYIRRLPPRTNRTGRFPMAYMYGVRSTRGLG